MHHCQILLLPRNHQKTKKSDWFAQILLILEAKSWWQSRKNNSFKPVILKSQFLKWHVLNCKVHNRFGKIENSILSARKFIEINLALSLTCSYEIVLKKWVYLPCNSKFLMFKSIFVNYLWIYFEIKYILNNLHIIICWIFLGWLLHFNAGKWYLSKQIRKHCAFGSVFCWLSSCFITFVFC